MNLLLAALLLPLSFTAPADTLGADAEGRVHVSPAPVHAYIFHRLDERGALTVTPGFADSSGSTILRPHVPGTRETVWLEPAPGGSEVTIYLTSRDRNGNTSSPSNGYVLKSRAPTPAPMAVQPAAWTALDVPIVRQSRERCGQAALAMVLRYYGADTLALHEVDSAYDPVLHGSLITDLAGAARRAGYEAAVATLTPDSLIRLLRDGVPPIVLYQNGSGLATFPHFGVVTGWDDARASFTLHDGGARPRVTRRDDLEKRWETAGSQALVVRQRVP